MNSWYPLGEIFCTLLRTYWYHNVVTDITKYTAMYLLISQCSYWYHRVHCYVPTYFDTKFVIIEILKILLFGFFRFLKPTFSIFRFRFCDYRNFENFNLWIFKFWKSTFSIFRFRFSIIMIIENRLIFRFMIFEKSIIFQFSKKILKFTQLWNPITF